MQSSGGEQCITLPKKIVQCVINLLKALHSSSSGEICNSNF